MPAGRLAGSTLRTGRPASAALTALFVLASAQFAPIRARADEVKVAWASSLPGSLRVTLSTGRASNAESQSIVLKLEITNVSAERVRVWLVTAPTDFLLTVRDAKAHLVAPARQRSLGMTPHHPVFLAPGQTFAESAPLREWGYDLAPGAYRIAAVLPVEKWRARSNEVHIAIAR